MNKKTYLTISFLVFLTSFIFSQSVTVDLSQQRFLGNTSDLNRSKFFNIHDKNFDAFTSTFFQTNNVGFGRRFFGPFAQYGLGNFPSTPATTDGIVRPVSRFVATANPKGIWRPGYNTTDASNAAIRYWIDEVVTNDRPEYWEPFNEPFVKAFDSAFDNDIVTGNPVSDSEVITRMSEWFRDMAQKVHSTTELSNMKVIGFSDAFPSFERNFFSNWRDRAKKFIDIAGADMDALSVHPYDGINVTGEDSRRSGSNSEAILDLLETYTQQKFGAPKKLAITEFGIIEANYPVGPSPSFYNESESAISIRGLNAMMFNFFEREDNIEICIPFITGRANFFYNNSSAIPDRPYVPAIIRPTEVQPGNASPPYRNDTYVFTFKENFYKFWKDVKGSRASVISNDLDIQAQVFVDDATVYLALNNLDDANKSVNLNFLNAPGTVTNVITKSLIIRGTDTPIFDGGTTTTSLPASVTLNDGETKILAITYSSTVSFTNSIVREKYYGVGSNVPTDKAPISPILANTANTFTISGVNKGTTGRATLRLGVGIRLDVNFFDPTPTGFQRTPTAISINGNTLLIPTNWKGYDQENRPDFFSVLEIDVPYNFINDSVDNIVSITYPQSSGSISSVILSIEREEGACTLTTLYADEDNDGLGDPANSVQNCGPLEGFVDNMDDQCPNDTENTCLGTPIPGTVEAENFTNGTASGVQVNGAGTLIGFINGGDETEYNVNVNVTGNYLVTVNAGAPSDAGGTITFFSNNVQVGTINITNTGGFNNIQAFTTTFSLATSGVQTLRLVYSGTGNSGGFLFDLDSVVFESQEAFVRFNEPIVATITPNQESFTLNMRYNTTAIGQGVFVELRRPDNSFFRNAIFTPATPENNSGRDFIITIPVADRPLAPGNYPLLHFINGGGISFSGGDGIQRFIEVVDPSLSTDDFNLKKKILKVVPNPVQGSLQLLTSEKINGKKYKIFNISGQKIASGIYGSSINVSNLSKGFYFIEINNTIVKFIKQ